MQSEKNPAVGIDLGTTNTVVAIQTDQMGPRIMYISQPKDDRMHLEDLPQIKSAVFFESSTDSVVGDFATGRNDAFRSIKSHMGTRWRAKHPVTKKLLKPSFISAHILKLAFQTLTNHFPEWDKTALITVPASFNTDQRNDTISSARMAGFQNVRLLDEPTAAFYYFFHQHQDSGDFMDIRNILIFDFGGGTLDVSIIQVKEENELKVLDAIGRSRYNNLGGDDIDLELASFLLACWEFEEGKEITQLSVNLRRKLYRLFIEKAGHYKEEVEDYLKQNLDMPEFAVLEDIYEEDETLSINFRRMLPRNIYEDITGKFLQPKSDLNIYRPIEEAISVAKDIKEGFSQDQIDLILFTGGTSNMANVQRTLGAYFAGKACFSLSEEDACNTVALGAACCRYEEVYGKRDVTMTNRLLEGIFTRQPGTSKYIVLVPLTCEFSEEFTEIKFDFKLQRAAIKLKLPLFRGVSAHDHQLTPMRDLEISLEQVIDQDTPYKISYRMTENKTIELKVTFSESTKSIEKIASIDLLNEVAEDNPNLQLCSVNEI
jgi:molecular chaperone DnaK